MKYIAYTFFSFLIVLSLNAQAQIKLHGQIINATNNNPIPYATLGIQDRSLGTVADENGKYYLEIPKDSILQQQSLIISSVGYLSKVMKVVNATQQFEMIALTLANTTLNEVKVKPAKFKTKTFGRTAHSAFMSSKMISESNHVSDELGKEIGTIIDIDKNCQLLDFNMFVIFNHFKSIKFRLNIYTVKNDVPDQLITTEDIKFDVTEGRQKLINVPLEKYNIYITGLEKIAITIQWIKSEIGEDPKRSFNVAATHSSSKTILFRDKSQSQWLKVNGYMSFYVTANSYK